MNLKDEDLLSPVNRYRIPKAVFASTCMRQAVHVNLIACTGIENRVQTSRGLDNRFSMPDPFRTALNGEALEPRRETELSSEQVAFNLSHYLQLFLLMRTAFPPVLPSTAQHSQIRLGPREEAGELQGNCMRALFCCQ